MGCAPTPLEAAPVKGVDEKGEEIEREIKVDDSVSAYVFKTIVDPFVGKISLLKVITGKLTGGLDLQNERAGKRKKRSPSRATPGDWGAPGRGRWATSKIGRGSCRERV